MRLRENMPLVELLQKELDATDCALRTAELDTFRRLQGRAAVLNDLLNIIQHA